MSIAIFTPPGVGKDEEEHIARAAQVAEGQLIPQKVDVHSTDNNILYVPEQYKNLDIYGGQTDSALYELLSKRYPSLHESEVSDMNFAFPYWTDSRYTVAKSTGESKTTWAFPNASVNSSLCYMPYSFAYLMANIAGAGPILCVILMRVLGVLTYGLLVRFAIKKTPICKRCLFLIAVLPNCFAVSTVVSADMMTNAFVFLFFAYLLRFLLSFENVNTKDYLGLGFSLICLGLLKMPYIAFGLLLFLIFFANKLWNNNRATLRIALIGTVALIAFFAWSLFTKGIATYTVWDIPNIDPDGQLSFIFNHPITAFKAMFAQLCSTDLGLTEMTAYALKPVPAWLIIFACIYFCVADVHGCHRVENRKIITISFICVSLLITILVIVALYLTFATVGATSYNGVQSRYFVPVLFPIFCSIIFSIGQNNNTFSACEPSETSQFFEKNVYATKPTIVFIVIYALFVFYAYSVWF